MAWYSPITRKLYMRIWLIVAGSVVVLSLLAGVIWHLGELARLRHPPERQIEVLSANGTVVDSEMEPLLRLPDGSLEFKADLDGRGKGPPVTVQIKPPVHSGIRDAWWEWLRPPVGFWGMLAITGVIVMACVFPLARQLTCRLERLQRGVQRWGEGDLSMRFSESGDDEVADLMRHFNIAADRIVMMMQSQKSLLAYASHEFRSPLARIRMAVELSHESDAMRPLARAEVLRSLKELDEIIEEILLASRMETQFGMYEVESVDLIGVLAEECAHAGATLNIAPGVAANPACAIVQGSPRLLHHAMRNLLENAVRYGKRSNGTSDNSVLLEHESMHREMLIHVDDRGSGVPPDQRERIFEPFYRMSGTGEGGVGLGLSLVRTIAQQHGGSVVCGDHEGGGARFTLRLPCAVAPQAA